MIDVVTPPERRAEYERLGLWDASTLSGQVAAHAAASPDATSVIDESGSRTWAELCQDASALAGWMIGAGVEPGQVVSVQLPNVYEFAVAAVASQSIGAVINPLLPNYRVRELMNVFATARPAMIITPGEYRGFDHRQLVGEVADATGVSPIALVVGDESFGEALESAPARPIGPGSAAAVSELIFTSGTEARPKAIMHTEQTANFSVRVARSDLGIDDSDVVWMPSPLGHSTGFNYGMRFALYHGIPLVLQDRWDADRAVELVTRERCSYTLAATTFLRDLVSAASARGVRLDSLRAFGCGGAPVPPPLVDQADAVGIGVLRLYGSTEVLVATWHRPGTPLEVRRSSDGPPMTDVEVEVRDSELYVRGPNTCVGFFEDPERTAATFGPDGWVRSGDLVTIDDDRNLTVVGRRKEIIIRGGLNITPREIEELLVDFDEVSQAAVIGLPDDRLGERMCACVILEPGAKLDLDTTIKRLKKVGLATYKLPERLEICDSFPMTASGKIQKHELVRLLE